MADGAIFRARVMGVSRPVEAGDIGSTGSGSLSVFIMIAENSPSPLRIEQSPFHSGTDDPESEYRQYPKNYLYQIFRAFANKDFLRSRVGLAKPD
jgi:hypothetical protein